MLWTLIIRGFEKAFFGLFFLTDIDDQTPNVKPSSLLSSMLLHFLCSESYKLQSRLEINKPWYPFVFHETIQSTLKNLRNNPTLYSIDNGILAKKDNLVLSNQRFLVSHWMFKMWPSPKQKVVKSGMYFKYIMSSVLSCLWCVLKWSQREWLSRLRLNWAYEGLRNLGPESFSS